MKEVLYYQCDHCPTKSVHFSYMKGHEKACLSNPDNKACRSCRFWFHNQPEMDHEFVCTLDADLTPRDFKQEPLPFCGCDINYSYVIVTDYWGDYGGGSHVKRKHCEGWQQIDRSYQEVGLSQ